jgi:hypothetical protein
VDAVKEVVLSRMLADRLSLVHGCEELDGRLEKRKLAKGRSGRTYSNSKVEVCQKSLNPSTSASTFQTDIISCFILRFSSLPT